MNEIQEHINRLENIQSPPPYPDLVSAVLFILKSQEAKKNLADALETCKRRNGNQSIIIANLQAQSADQAKNILDLSKSLEKLQDELQDAHELCTKQEKTIQDLRQELFDSRKENLEMANQVIAESKKHDFQIVFNNRLFKSVGIYYQLFGGQVHHLVKDKWVLSDKYPTIPLFVQDIINGYLTKH